MFHQLVVICVVIVAVVESARELPSYMKVCGRNDPNLTDCWIDSAMKIIPLLKGGLSELNLRPIEPIVIARMDIDYGSGQSISVAAKLRNLELYGCSNISITGGEIKYDDKHVLVKLNLSIPSLYLTSGYTAQGQVLLIKFNSKGNLHSNLSDVSVEGYWRSEKIIKGVKEHGIFKDSHVAADIKQMNIYFSKIFENNDELNDQFNRVVNENIDILYDELRPTIENSIDAIVKDSVNKVYELYPLDVLYPVKP